jgi:hypothetical protein
MTTLAQVLSKRSEITNLVKQFGYSGEVKIHYDLPEEGQKIKVKFIVNEISGQSVPHDNEAFLEAKLSALLDSEIEVTASNYIPELNQYDTNRKSAFITNERAIKEVIYKINNDIHDDRLIENDALDTITLENVELKGLNKTDRLYLGLLKQADEYLKKSVNQLKSSVNSESYARSSLLSFSSENKQKRQLDGESMVQEQPRLKVKREGKLRIVELIIPIPEDLNCDESTMISTEIADDLASQYLAKIDGKSTPSPTKAPN